MELNLSPAPFCTFYCPLFSISSIFYYSFVCFIRTVCVWQHFISCCQLWNNKWHINEGYLLGMFGTQKNVRWEKPIFNWGTHKNMNAYSWFFIEQWQRLLLLFLFNFTSFNSTSCDELFWHKRNKSILDFYFFNQTNERKYHMWKCQLKMFPNVDIPSAVFI